MSAAGVDARLERFLAAQAPVFAGALAELRAGRKRGHWMWFVLPQLRGLGASSMAVRHGIASLDEARAYLSHPVLGARLRECLEAILMHPDTPLVDILGAVDAMKHRSCVTLFSRAGGDDAVFARSLRVFHQGRECPLTRELLGDGPEGDAAAGAGTGGTGS